MTNPVGTMTVKLVIDTAGAEDGINRIVDARLKRERENSKRRSRAQRVVDHLQGARLTTAEANYIINAVVCRTVG